MADTSSNSKKRRLLALEKRQISPTIHSPNTLNQTGNSSTPHGRQNQQRPSFTPPSVNRTFKSKDSDRALDSPFREADKSPLNLDATKSEDTESVYLPLNYSLLAISDSLRSAGNEFANPQAFVQMLLRSLLEGNRNIVDVVGALDERLQGKVVLLENPPGKLGRSKKAFEQASLRSPDHMSLTAHRKAGSFTIPKDLQRYSLYTGLNRFWVDYLGQITRNCSEAILLSRLLGADLHGAIISVSRSRDPVMVALKGIVLRETTNAFHIVTTANCLKVLPKKGSIFIVSYGDMLITLVGDRLVGRNIKNNV